MLVFALVEAVAAGDEFCAFFFADVDVAEVGLKLAFVNGRSISTVSSRPLPTLIFLARATNWSTNWR